MDAGDRSSGTANPGTGSAGDRHPGLDQYKELMAEAERLQLQGETAVRASN
jgi:hypothetical protein